MLNQTSGIKQITGYPAQLTAFSFEGASNPATEDTRQNNRDQEQTHDRVDLSREVQELQSDHVKKKESLEKNYDSEKQVLESKYRQEKNRLEREFSRKKQSLTINVFA